GFARRRDDAPVIERQPVDPAARRFIYVFAMTPIIAIGALAFVTGRSEAFVGPPLVALTALAVVVLAPDRIRLAYQKLTAAAWVAILVLPPLAVAMAVVLLPWTLGTELQVSQRAAAIGKFFGENFERRAGRPLAIVAGDQRLASLIAMSAPSRPSLVFTSLPETAPWPTRQDI